MQQDRQEHQRRAERIETLIQEVTAFPDDHARATTEELLQALLDMYGEGLAHILEIIMQSKASGYELLDAFAGDELVSSLLMLHGLHPADIEERIAHALNEVRPYLQSHGGNVQLLRVENGVAYLRLEGSCNGCSASTATLQQTIEKAIYEAAPDLDRLEVDGAVPAPARVAAPVTFVPRQKTLRS